MAVKLRLTKIGRKHAPITDSCDRFKKRMETN